jgi:hypothetical protein
MQMIKPMMQTKIPASQPHLLSLLLAKVITVNIKEMMVPIKHITPNPINNAAVAIN